MDFQPRTSVATRQEALPGAFCFVPGPDARVTFGLIVQAAQDSRPFDFLAFDTFKVWQTKAGSGLDTFFLLPDAFLLPAQPLGDHISTCIAGKTPPLGSILFRPEGAAILGMAGSDHEAFHVVFDLRTGNYLDNSLYHAAHCDDWQVVNPSTNGGHTILYENNSPAT